jgi:hypothetical protein
MPVVPRIGWADHGYEVKRPARGNHLAVILEGEAEDGASPA